MVAALVGCRRGHSYALSLPADHWSIQHLQHQHSEQRRAAAQDVERFFAVPRMYLFVCSLSPDVIVACARDKCVQLLVLIATHQPGCCLHHCGCSAVLSVSPGFFPVMSGCKRARQPPRIVAIGSSSIPRAAPHRRPPGERAGAPVSAGPTTPLVT